MSESKQLESIFSRAMQLPDDAERRRYVEHACGGDVQLAQQVSSLLKAARESESFLESPVRQSSRANPSAQLTGHWEPQSSNRDFPFLKAPIVSDDLGSLGPYRILNRVGRGGMGIVFRAFDPKLQRVVAVKVLAPEIAIDPMARKRFEREARSAAAVTHPHVVVIHAVDESHNPPYLVMEFIQGKTLADKLATQGALSVKEILRIGGQVAEGLAAAHQQGLVHRDVKPANILLENGVERAKVTDFGLAKAVDDMAMTRTGDLSGTPQYMSPEQASGGLIDHRTDLYSLGSVLYAMCTGKPPFRADNPLVLLKRVCEDVSRPIQQINPDAPDWLCVIVDRLLAKSPADRIQTAAEVASLLHKHLALLQAGPNVVLPAINTKPLPQSNSLWRWRSLVFTVGILAAICIVTWIAVAKKPFGNPIVVAEAYSTGGKQPITPNQVPRDEKPEVAAKPEGMLPMVIDDPAIKLWMKDVALQPAELQLELVAKKLQELNQGFDGKLTGGVGNDLPKIENGVVTELGMSTSQLTDISPVRALVGLKWLNCDGNWTTRDGKLSDLSPLQGLGLQTLSFNFTQVIDISPLAGMPLNNVSCFSSRVESLEPLKGMHLTYLAIGGTNVADLDPLRGMRLGSLNFGGTLVSDLSPIQGMPLVELGCAAGRVSDLSPLEGMKLTILRLKPEKIIKGANAIRQMSTLTVIDAIYQGKHEQLTPTEFWKKFDAGEYKH